MFLIRTWHTSTIFYPFFLPSVPPPQHHVYTILYLLPMNLYENFLSLFLLLVFKIFLIKYLIYFEFILVKKWDSHAFYFSPNVRPSIFLDESIFSPLFFRWIYLFPIDINYFSVLYYIFVLFLSSQICYKYFCQFISVLVPFFKI